MDACGDSNSCSQVVTLIDTTPPVINCPTNVIIVNLNSNCQLVIPPISVTATDNCTPTCFLVYSQSPPAGTVISGSSANVTVTVTDLCGNSNSCVVLVEGQDKQPPIVVVPQTIIVTNCIVPCVPVSARAVCCPSLPTVTQSPPCGAPLGPGVNTITVTVTDCHGNSVTRIVHLIIAGSGNFLSALTNTGVGPGGILLPDDTGDPYYALAAGSTPAGMPADYHNDSVAVSDLCHPTGNGCAYFNTYTPNICYEYVPWSLPPDPAHVPGAVSKWIAPDYTNNGCCPGGNYTYTLTFTLPAGLNPATATISGRWAADNAATMKLNGSLLALPSPGFSYWTPFTIAPSAIMTPGVNTLQFIVNNFGSFTGLRVEFTNAFAACEKCVPPSITSITPAESLQAGSTATLNVVASGTPPLSYQWDFNSSPIAGATGSTLQIHGITYSNAGLYTVIVSDPCGSVTDYVRVAVTRPLPWQTGIWSVETITNPLAATLGSDLLGLGGSNAAPNYSINVGTADDFGITAPDGENPNVMDINPYAGAIIQLPMITSPGSTEDDSYTLIMDLYEPDTSLGTPSTLFMSDYDTNPATAGQSGTQVTLDASNYMHLTQISDGIVFDAVSAEPFAVDTWNRLVIVVQGAQADGTGASVNAYLNGLTIVTNVTGICPCCVLHIQPIDWNVAPPVILSTAPGAANPNGEFFVTGIQFHNIAMTSEMIAGIGSPDIGPAPVNPTSTSAPPPLTATINAGGIIVVWPGSPYELQETTDLGGGAWTESTLPFTETEVNGNVMTSATTSPSTSGPSKFYRLVFRP